MTNQSEQAEGLEETQIHHLWQKHAIGLDKIVDETEYLDLRNAMTFDQFLNAVKEWQQSQPGIKQWVSVEDRLPPLTKKPNDQISTSEPVWVYDKVMGYYTAWLKRFDKDSGDWDTLDPHKVGDLKWECPHYGFNSVTHWQPLPLQPNSTTTPKSDMVSKVAVIKLIQDLRNKYKQDQTPLSERVIQECITKIKEI